MTMIMIISSAVRGELVEQQRLAIGSGSEDNDCGTPCAPAKLPSRSRKNGNLERERGGSRGSKAGNVVCLCTPRRAPIIST